MTACAELRVWAVAAGDNVLTVSVLCAEHASWARDIENGLPIGMHVFQVLARAWIRRFRRSGCTECAFRGGRPLRISDAGALGAIKRSELAQVGGEA
jgi:hypothetical protein